MTRLQSARRRSRRVIDWAPIKAAYIEGVIDGVGNRVFPSYDAVGEKFGVHPKLAAQRGARESWLDRRRRFLDQIESRRQDKKASILATTMASFDARAVRLAERLMRQVEQKLDRAENEAMPQLIGHQELRALAQVAREAQIVGRLALGDSTANAARLASAPDRPDLSKFTTDELRMFERFTMMANGVPVDDLPPIPTTMLTLGVKPCIEV